MNVLSLIPLVPYQLNHCILLHIQLTISKVKSTLFQSCHPTAIVHSMLPFHCSEHFHPNPAGLTPSYSCSLPTDGQVIALTSLIMHSHYAEKQRIAWQIFSWLKRTIAPLCFSETETLEKLSCQTDKILQLIVQQQKSHPKDITASINCIEKIKLPKELILVSMEVMSYYTNICSNPPLIISYRKGCSLRHTAESKIITRWKNQTYQGVSCKDL